jgi:hypothetical protein
MNYIPHIRLGVGKDKPLVRFEQAAVLAWLNSKREAGRPTRLQSKFTGAA